MTEVAATGSDDATLQQGTAAGLSFWRRPGPGPTLVLLHGIGSRGESFLPVLPHLPMDWDVVAWDAPGYGGSEPLGALWPTEADYAAALDRFAAALRLTDFMLVGHSLGTLIAARFAREYPQKVPALVLASSTCGHGVSPFGPLSAKGRERIEAFDAEGPAEFAKKRAPRLLVDPGNGVALRRVTEAMAAVRMPGYGQAVRMLASGRLEANLAAVEAPVTLVWGTGDVITPRTESERAAAACGGAPLIEIEDAGHALHSEAPAAFASALITAGQNRSKERG